MTIAVGAKMKDENYFAEAPTALRNRDRRPVSKTVPLTAEQSSNRQRGAPLRLFYKRKGSDLPVQFLEDIEAFSLLLGAGKGALAQLPERYFAAHGFAVGLA